jgi:hypothetical protein
MKRKAPDAPRRSSETPKDAPTKRSEFLNKSHADVVDFAAEVADSSLFKILDLLNMDNSMEVRAKLWGEMNGDKNNKYTGSAAQNLQLTEHVKSLYPNLEE